MDNKICLPDNDKRSFYRSIKEDLEFYMSTVDEDDYYFIFKPVGPPSDKPFIQLEGQMAKEVMEHLRLYFANKMNRPE